MRRTIRGREVRLQRRLPRSRRALWHHAVVQRRAPKWLEVTACFALLLPIGPHKLVARALRFAQQNGQEFVRGATAVKRRDHRLDDARRAVERA
ncbi:MAG TPA: hypothetical protein VJ828_05880, partial [Lacipirellulaceae bacterium]|nr:hypothetical protein [Lacipirellulaceae bacterium]